MSKKNSLILIVTICLLIGGVAFFTIQNKPTDVTPQPVGQPKSIVWKEYRDVKYGYTISYEDTLTIKSDHSDASAFADYASWMKIGKNGSDSISFTDGADGFGWRSVVAMDTLLTPKEYLSAMKANEMEKDGSDVVVIDKETIISGIPAIIFHHETKGQPYPNGDENTHVLLKSKDILFEFSARGGSGDDHFIQSIQFY
jgi:hypothetical protein